MTDKNKTLSKYYVYGYCLFLSAVYLLFCTESSPLYPFNVWVDANAFFTMGKGMMNGKVLYRDLFEQKGPLLYFIHGLSYLISHRTFLGVYIFEVISFSIFLFYSHKLILLFLDIKYSIISLPLITAIILNMRNFSHGDSAEEFCLPLMAISLFYLIRYFKNTSSDLVSGRVLLINGIIAGCVLWIKFTLLGFWFAWMASVFFCMIFNNTNRGSASVASDVNYTSELPANNNFLHAIKACFIFLLGMLLATVPWLIYFGINHAIAPWIDTYIFVNFHSYPNKMPLMQRVLYILFNINKNLFRNWIFGIISYLGVITFIISKKYIKSVLNRICFFLCFIFLSLGVYGGGRAYIYYFVIFSPFVTFGFIVLFDLLNLYMNKVISFRITAVIVLISLLITYPLTFSYNHNTDLLKYHKGDLVQYEYASIMKKTPNATLLNYGSLDAGFYTVAGITPNIRFFQRLNIAYNMFPLNIDEQNRYIKDRMTKYVIIRENALGESGLRYIPHLYENYRMVTVKEQLYEGNNYNYYLFKLK